jgi:hypothetical protein
VSDYNPFIEGGEPSPPESGPEIDLGQPADDGQPTEQLVDDAPRDYLDLDQYGNHVARVKVDGEELEVPIKEALQGYSRTADYTRKTQELAQQRQAAEYALTVERALRAQPEETLRLLAKQYGVQFEQSPPQIQREQPSYNDGLDDEPYRQADPVMQRIEAQQQVIDSMAEREAQREASTQLRAAIGGLQTKYQLDDATAREVVQTALQAHVGPEWFETIYKNIAFDRAHRARAEAQAVRGRQEAARRQAGAEASQLIGNGASANGAGATVPLGASDGHMSVSDAYELALKEHGLG